MKNSTKFLLSILIGNLYVAAFATVIQVSAPNNLQSFVNTLNDGDIIELTTAGNGTNNYTWSGELKVATEKSITVRAKSGLTLRPIVVFTGSTGGFMRYNTASSLVPTKTWTFDGIDFDGYNAAAGYYATSFIYSYVTAPYYGINIKLNNCVFKNFSGRTIQYQGTGGTTASTLAQGGNISVTNSEFRKIGTGVLGTNTVLMYNPDNVSFTNCLFEGPGINTIFVELNAPNYNSYLIDHCTFINSNRREMYLNDTKSTSYIRNCIFVNNINSNSNNRYNVTLGSNCGIYYTGTGNKNNIYPFSTAVRTANPVLNATTGIATASTYLTGTTDGLPGGFYGNQIVYSEAELNDLSYTAGNGPSAAKSFRVSASRLTNNLTITSPANFEISTLPTTGFTSTSISLNQTGGSIASTLIYVRLKSGLADNLYSGTIQLTSAGAAPQQITVWGTVVGRPTIFTSLNQLTGFVYKAGSGPSLQSSFVLNGAGLTQSVTITAPENFELSLNSGTSFSGSSSLSISPIVGKVSNLTIFVRMKAGLSQNSYSGSVIVTSTGADTKMVSVSGIVNPAPVVLNVSKSSLLNFSYVNGNGPSAIQTFNVSGTGITTNIKITAPQAYEISTITGTSFAGTSSISLMPTNGNVSTINIYVRLKKDLAVGTYDQNITIETAGATTKQLNLSGFVSEATGVTLSASALTGFEYVLSNGPSVEKSFDMTGVNLNSYVIVSAPANYEVSTTNGAAFSGSGQILLDQAAISGQSLRIYVRMLAGLSVGAYSGNLTVASSGATTKTISLSGNVYNPLVIATDPATYDPRFGGNFTFRNKWILSKNTSNYSLANELVAASGMARDMAVRNGKMLFMDRANKRIVVLNGDTGEKESAVNLNPTMFSYVGRNVTNTADSVYLAGTYQFYGIKVDDAGNVLVSNLITTNGGRLQLYKVDMSTGNGTLLIDQANLANLFPLATTLRLDYFSVWGNVSTNAVILAANSSASAMEVYKWVISGGIVGAPSVIKLDNTTVGTYFTGLESLGGYPRIFAVAADKFYVDGGVTYPTLVNTTGSILDGFHRQPVALKDSVTIFGQKLDMNTGNNGVWEFSMGGQHFLVTSASNTAGTPASAFRLYKFRDASKSFSSIDCLWTFPQAGMGTASNSYRTAIPVVVVTGYAAKIYIYCGENGLAMYELNMNPVFTGLDKNTTENFPILYRQQEFILPKIVKKLDVYSLTGQLVKSFTNISAAKAPTTSGVYMVKITTAEGRLISQKVMVN